MTVVLEIILGLAVLASVLVAVFGPGRLKGFGGPRRPGRDGGAGAGDRAARTPRVPVLSGGAARKLGEDD